MTIPPLKVVSDEHDSIENLSNDHNCTSYKYDEYKEVDLDSSSEFDDK